MTISNCFETLRKSHQCALIPFITAGDPDLETTAKALQVLDDNGADAIELGVPYSDPLADGPVIQAAASRALQRGTRLDSVLEMVEKVSPNLRSPIILFTYYNPILYRGIETFLQQIKSAGVEGLVVPDLPLEEADSLIQPANKLGIELTLLVAPTSPKSRIEAIARESQGFIYLVSVTGVTGVREGLEKRAKELLQELRSITDKPIGIGFGISKPEHARQGTAWGAAAELGSARRLRKTSKRVVARTPQHHRQTHWDRVWYIETRTRSPSERMGCRRCDCWECFCETFGPRNSRTGFRGDRRILQESKNSDSKCLGTVQILSAIRQMCAIEICRDNCD